jgi:hypothetical protein
MTAVELRLAVMEDETVLCAECVHEFQTEGLPETAATIVHAWLTDEVGEACRCCGATHEEARS